MHFLQESKFAKLRSQLVSVLLKNSESQKNKSTSANRIAKLKSNLKTMKNWKDSNKSTSANRIAKLKSNLKTMKNWKDSRTHAVQSLYHPPAPTAGTPSTQHKIKNKHVTQA
jgi:hypothetical protein